AGKHDNSAHDEGGTQLLQTFINAGLWDEARIFTGKMTFGNGIPAPEIDGNIINKYKMNDSELQIFEKKLPLHRQINEHDTY
ncbi:hypothetical protein EZS27_025152, partial [termite gut metagenome]